MYVVALLKDKAKLKYRLEPGTRIHRKDLEIVAMSSMLGDAKTVAEMVCRETDDKVLILRDYNNGSGRFLKLKVIAC